MLINYSFIPGDFNRKSEVQNDREYTQAKWLRNTLRNEKVIGLESKISFLVINRYKKYISTINIFNRSDFLYENEKL